KPCRNWSADKASSNSASPPVLQQEGSLMKKSFCLGVLSLFLCITAVSRSARSRQQDRAALSGIEDQFVGAWRLAWLEEPDGERHVHKADCTGLLVFTRDGHMSVQVMYRNPQAGSQAGPAQYAQGGYEASFGTYKIDEATHTFTFHVEGAMVRSLVGRELSRSFELSGGQLIVKSTDAKESWRAAWTR